MIELEERAVQAERAGNLKQAIDLWQQVLEGDPENLRARTALGVLYYRLKLYQKATSYLEEALSRNHSDVSLRMMLAQSLVQLGRFSEAEEEFRTVIEQAPEHIPARVELARLYLKQQEVRPALELLEEALRHKPTDLQVHWQLGQLYRSLGNLEQAEIHLRKILEIRSESPLAQEARKLLEEAYAEARGVPREKLDVLRAENLVKYYGKRPVVRHVSIEVRQGEIVGLLGPNGAGKTTTFYMIVGMIRPNAGRIFLNDQDITKMPMYKRARLGIGYLSQEPSIFRKLTVEENILAILETLKLPDNERKRRLEQLLEEFGLQHIRKNKGYNLSGGERRRGEIAREKLPGRWFCGPSFCCWMNPLLESIQLQWKIFRISFTGCGKKGLEFLLQIITCMRRWRLRTGPICCTMGGCSNPVPPSFWQTIRRPEPCILGTNSVWTDEFISKIRKMRAGAEKNCRHFWNRKIKFVYLTDDD